MSPSTFEDLQHEIRIVLINHSLGVLSATQAIAQITKLVSNEEQD